MIERRRPPSGTRAAAIVAALAILVTACASPDDESPSEEDVRPVPSPGTVMVEGRLTEEGVECPALRDDDERLYTLAGSLGGFEPGDRVRVEGTLPDASICMQGTTIEVARIEAAAGPADGTGEESTGEPSIDVSAGAAAPGETVTVRASGFPPDRSVDIGFGPPQSEYDVIANARTDADGRIERNVEVPSWAESGRDYLFVVATPDTRIKAISDPVTIR